MKKLFLGPIFLLLSFSPLSAQERAKLKSVEVSFGDSAFTSGLNVSTLFSLNQHTDMEVVGNSERFYVTANFKSGKRNQFSFDLTGGAFKKLPWVGPRLTYYPVKKLMVMYWGGWSSGRIGNLQPQVKSFFQQGSVYVMPTKNWSVGYNIVKLDVYKTTQIPEVAYHHSLTEHIRVGGSASYDSVSQKPLFCVSLKYTL